MIASGLRDHTLHDRMHTIITLLLALLLGVVVFKLWNHRRSVRRLRNALINANSAPGRQHIEFNIAGACPHVIRVESVLPALTDLVSIDGYSQPGARANDSLLGFIQAGMPKAAQAVLNAQARDLSEEKKAERRYQMQQRGSLLGKLRAALRKRIEADSRGPATKRQRRLRTKSPARGNAGPRPRWPRHGPKDAPFSSTLPRPGA